MEIKKKSFQFIFAVLIFYFCLYSIFFFNQLFFSQLIDEEFIIFSALWLVFFIIFSPTIQIINQLLIDRVEVHFKIFGEIFKNFFELTLTLLNFNYINKFSLSWIFDRFNIIFSKNISFFVNSEKMLFYQNINFLLIFIQKFVMFLFLFFVFNKSIINIIINSQIKKIFIVFLILESLL